MKTNPASFCHARAIGTLLIVIIFDLLAAASGKGAGEAPYYRDLFSDTWVGHDALGRNVPTCSEVGPVKKDHRRVVGIFYITWHSDSAHKLKSPYVADVSRVLAAIRRRGWMPNIRSGPRARITGVSRRRATS